ncbi:saccharopine dehydrogenase NADP-binding domain-containing protein [Nocardiopsis ansamitocini]|uniref:Epimerase n=1 Tax=Nocardiopsis ansamitocini TaxID=1670832 RepID=A0A9W6PAW9_9ACTN|nr:saccharopine dehydrogenase NADP-binding domain-containing protein [Nocardiopsis ansamitocini]GLU50202.1 epimerase [Nocardiopsis ansamitocini]
MTAPIAVLGATGAVGTAAARALHGLWPGPLRLGARGPAPLRALTAELGPGTEAVVVDLADDAALSAFCAGARVVLNCAGPSYAVVDRVALAALAAGADYADVTGDDPCHDRLAPLGLAERGRTAVLSAGVLPGLSALLPRLLTPHGADAHLSAYTGGLEECTPTAAADMALSLPGSATGFSFGESLAAWRGGRRVARALRAQEGVRVPFFPASAHLQPFLTGEAERLAVDLGFDGLDWYTVHPGTAARAVLTEAAGRPLHRAEEFDRFTARLRAAADLDLAGRVPYYLLAYVLTDRVAGRGRVRSLAVRLTDSYRTTGYVGALAAHALVGGRIEPGVHYAARVLDPADTVARLTDAGVMEPVRFQEGVPQFDDVEEGAL